MAQIGIFGGTFNPPHVGHLHAASAAQKSLSLDKVIFIPAKDPPHKELPSDSATPEQRCEMISLAVSQYPWAEVSPMELLSEGKSYTVNTLRQLKKEYADDTLWLIVGTDMFLTLDDWHLPKELMSLASIAVVARNDGDSEKFFEAKKKFSDTYNATIHIVNCEALPISSTELRDVLDDGEGKVYVPNEVYDYICNHRLYNCK